MTSQAETYVHIIEIILTIAILADIVLGVIVCKNRVLVKPLYRSFEKSQIQKTIAIRSVFYVIMMWALFDRNLGASDFGYIAVMYIGVLAKGFYDVKYNNGNVEDNGL